MFKGIKNEKGFTLIELLVVVAIIGILVAIAIPQFSAYKKQANDSAASSATRNLALAAEAYYAANGFYPNDVAASTAAAVTALGVFTGFSDSATAITLVFDNLGGTPQTFSITGTHGAGSGKTYTYLSASGGMQ